MKFFEGETMKRTAVSALLSGTSLMALSFAMISTAAVAQDQQAAVEEVVVTGSRLTTGFETPTPVTVMSADALQSASPNGIADALAQTPALSTTLLSSTPQTAANGNNGQSLLNLRNLGAIRSLVLIDGRRTVATNQGGTVDVNTMPQNLVSRVDVVTGGASASYGSDAVAGVVNFILDTQFTGVKGDVGGGISRVGDLPIGKASLAGGFGLFDNRLHIIASTQWFRRDGIDALTPTHRKWFDQPKGLIPNTDKVVYPGTTTVPTNIIVNDIRNAIGSPGGVITASSGGTANLLKGIAFDANGKPIPFNYGTQVGSTYMSGGDGARPNISFAPDERRSANFVHAEYSVTDDVTAWGEAAYTYAFAHSGNEVAAQTGAFAATIFSGNPYIPASIQATMTAGGIKSFTLGRYTSEFDLIGIDLKTRVFRQAGGIKGNAPFGLDGWHWDISFSNGRTSQYAPETNLTITPNYFAAADVVVHPTTGKYVCRSQYYDAAGNFVAGGTGLNPGCVPMDLFGAGSISKAAENYVTGTSWKNLVLTQRVFQANISGDLGERLQLGAGPIGVAAGGEYHTESAYQTTDALSPTDVLATLPTVSGVRGIPSARIGTGLGPYRFYNPKPFSGKFNVKEGFVEFGVPILKGLDIAKSLSAQLAARYTDYSVSGTVTTWKSGLDYQPIEDVRFRGTISRDIRAPTLLDLFNSSTQANNTNPFPCATCSTVTVAGGTGVVTTPTLVVSNIGNLNLVPEKAITKTYGTVLTPTFVPGLQLSLDYYNIKINGAISAPGTGTILNNCYQNNLPSYCPLAVYTPPPNNAVRSAANPGSLIVYNQSINYSTSVVSGLDFEANYKTELLGNPLSLHLLANHVMTDYSQAPLAVAINTVGTDTSPHWRLTGSVQYAVSGFNVQFQERYISPSLMSATLLEPTGTNNNHIPTYWISDLTVTYDLSNSFDSLGSGNQLYLTVNNLFNAAPPTDLAPPTTFSQPTNRSVYDGIGQFFNMGVRFKF